MLPRIPRVLLVAALALPIASGLSGCHDDDDPVAQTPSLEITPSMGLVRNATVVIRDASGAQVGTGELDSNGVVTIAATGNAPYIVEVQGDADAEYFDENIGGFVAFPSGVLHALVPAGVSQVAVTGLTELAWSLWTAGGAPLSDTNIVLANDAVLAYFAPAAPAGLDNILTLPTLLGATPADGDLGANAADLHALILAALAELGDGDPDGAPALSIIMQLSRDLSDGVLNGADGDGAISGLLYDYTTIESNLASAMDTLAQPWGDTTIESLASGYTLGTLDVPAWDGLVTVDVTVSGFSPGTGAVGASITITGEGFDADKFHMQVKFSSNITAEIVSASATELVVTVPAGAVTGPITVTNTLATSTFTTTGNFTVTGGGGGGGDIWLSRASPSGYILNGLAYGNSTFVAAGFGKTILTSTDGVSWSAGTSPDNNWYQANAIAYDGTRFIMVGDTTNYSTPVPLIATSTDGTTWTRKTWSPSSTEYQLIDVCAANGKITVIGLNGVIAYSTNAGDTWTNETQSSAASLTGVAANDTVRVAVGRDGSYNGIIIVENGSGWTNVAITEFYPRAVTWTGTQFVAVGSTSSAGNSNPVVMTSANGTAWTRYALSAEEASTGKPLQKVIWDATTSKLYATGHNGGNAHIIVSSTNGSTWAIEYEGTVSGNGTLPGIAASPTRIVTVGGVKSVTKP